MSKSFAFAGALLLIGAGTAVAQTPSTPTVWGANYHGGASAEAFPAQPSTLVPLPLRDSRAVSFENAPRPLRHTLRRHR